MVFDNILFHNVEELEAADKGLMMWRLPKYVRERVNEGIETITGRYTTGVEFRFKMKTDSVRLYLRADEAFEAQVAYVFFGSIQGGWQSSSFVIGREKTEIIIRKPDNMDVLKQISERQKFAFNPEVVRVVLPYGHIYYCGIAGDVEAPAQKDLPQKTYLAYGSSITHGSLALAAPYSYCFRVAQMMNCDYINLGFAGSAQMEEGMAEYIMSRKDWDFASFEMGINMIDLPEKLFEENVCRFTEAFTKEERPIFFTDIYGSNEQEPNQTTIIRYREIARQQFLKQLSQKKNAVYVSGLELLNNPSFLSQDLTHPSLEGIDEIAKNWFHVMSRF